MSPPQGPCADSQLVFKNQLRASATLTLPGRYKRTESYLPADEKAQNQGDPGSCLVIYLYL